MSRPNPRKLLDAQTLDALRAAGYSEEELLSEQPFGPVISQYGRAQAIADGQLIDVSDVARAEGFKIPVAITCGACGELGIDGRPSAALRQVLRTLRDEAARPANRQTDRVFFVVGDVDLWALVGPGDDPAPVLTVMLVGED